MSLHDDGKYIAYLFRNKKRISKPQTHTDGSATLSKVFCRPQKSTASWRLSPWPLTTSLGCDFRPESPKLSNFLRVETTWAQGVEWVTITSFVTTPKAACILAHLPKENLTQANVLFFELLADICCPSHGRSWSNESTELPLGRSCARAAGKVVQGQLAKLCKGSGEARKGQNL